jgi:CheY-like chemotaxis protein
MRIGTLGFPADQLKKLEKILSLSKQSLALVSFDRRQLPDLLLLFGPEQLQQPDIAELPGSYRTRLVLISKTRPESDDLAHIKFPLISSRVIRTLEQFQPLPPAPVDVPLDTDSGAKADVETDIESDVETSENPFSKYDAQIAAVQQQQQSAPTARDMRSYSVLVVDDSHPMQQMLARELEQLEHPVNIDFADDGEAALSRVADRHYDFIFLDIMMPGIDGFETCTRMRAMPALKKTPIIMLSSKTSPLDEVKGIMAGSSTYLTKPIEHAEFQKVIRRVSRWVSEFRK